MHNPLTTRVQWSSPSNQNVDHPSNSSKAKYSIVKTPYLKFQSYEMTYFQKIKEGVISLQRINVIGAAQKAKSCCDEPIWIAKLFIHHGSLDLPSPQTHNRIAVLTFTAFSTRNQCATTLFLSLRSWW